MRYTLFAGGRIGYEALKLMSAQAVQIDQVFLEPEHPHEQISYSNMIKEFCQERAINVSDQLDKTYMLSVCERISPDYLMCFGYRRMLSPEVCACAQIACIGSHFAPLPRYRGFAPLNWVLINGEKQTAVNIFFLADKVDAGDIIARREINISYDDDINTLTDKCVRELPDVLANALIQLETGNPQGEKQDESKATYTCSRNPEDGLIDWTQSSEEIYNLVRALTYPMPGAYTYYNGEKLYVWRCQIVDELPYEGRVCGKIIAIDQNKGIKVLTGNGSLWLTKLSADPNQPDVNPYEFKSIRVTLGHPNIVQA